MINPSFHLFQLQKIDLKIDTLTKRLGEIDRIRSDNSARMALVQSLTVKTDALTVQKSIYAEIDTKVNAKKMKIEQSESSLYGGSIKNPKELQDLQSEIRSLKQSQSALEDDEIQAMLDIEEIEKEISSLEKILQEFDARLNEQYSILFTEESEKKTEIEKLSHERKAVLDQINPENLTLYQSLRKSKNGIALATIEDGCCTVCGTTLTPADCQTAKSPTKMATCASCGRILYAG